MNKDVNINSHMLNDLDSTYLSLIVRESLINGIYDLKEISKVLYKYVDKDYEKFARHLPLFLATQALMLNKNHLIDIYFLNELSVEFFKDGINNHLGKNLINPSFFDGLLRNRKPIKSNIIRTDGIYLYQENKRTVNGNSVKCTFLLVFNTHGIVMKVFSEGFITPSSKEILEIIDEFKNIKEENNSDFLEYDSAYNLFGFGSISAVGNEYFIGTIEEDSLVVTLSSNLLDLSTGAWMNDKILNLCRFKFVG